MGEFFLVLILVIAVGAAAWAINEFRDSNSADLSSAGFISASFISSPSPGTPTLP